MLQAMDLLTRLLAISFVIAACCTTVYCNHDDQPSLYFALMVSSAPTLNTSGVVSAVDQALEVVNRADSNVLPGVRLQYTTVLDTRVRQVLVAIVEGASTKN